MVTKHYIYYIFIEMHKYYFVNINVFKGRVTFWLIVPFTMNMENCYIQNVTDRKEYLKYRMYNSNKLQ